MFFRTFFGIALALLGPSEACAQDAATDTAAGTDTGAAEADTAAAEAPPPPTEAELQEARHAFEVAAAAFENGDYETASTEFRTAYELSRHAALLYNIYLAEERAGRPGEAATMLERYLESDLPTPEERTVLERRLERLRTRAASREPVVDPTESGSDRAALIVAPTDAAGQAWEREAPVTGPPVAGIAVLVTGGVMLAAFAVLAPLSEAEDQRLAGTCGRSAGSYCTADQVQTLTALNIAADASWIAGAATAAVGLVLLFALPPERAGSTTIAPTASPEHAGITVRGRF